MAITDTPDEIQAYLTDDARTYIARAINGELVFKASGFSVGRGGYNPADPVHILPVDTTVQLLADQVYPDVTGDVPFQSIDFVADTALVYNCRLPATTVTGNADYGLGEIGIWAEIISSPANPGDVGTVFLFAIGHMPIRCKTRRDVMLFRVVVNF